VALHTSFHSVSSPDTETDKDAQDTLQKSPVTFSQMRAFGNPSPSLMKKLSTEIENLIVETNIRKDEVGPLRAAWETALKRWRKSKSVRSKSSLAEDEKLKKAPPAPEPDKIQQSPETN
jgi:hypothetical protein